MAYKTVKAEQVVEKFRYAYDNKWGYIWGTAGVAWTKAKQDQLNKTTDANRESSRKYGAQWIGHTVADCSGLFSWAYKQLGSYMYHGSNTMWRSYCVDKGDLSAGKRTDGKTLKPGTAVFTDHSGDKTHVGLYVGNGEVIEASSPKVGVIKSKISDKKWKCWGELKYTDYTDEVTDKPVEKDPYTVTYPTIRIGARGEIVTQLQDLLAKAGSNLAIDGIFGSGTQSAVRAFQKKNGLVVDGIVGPKTWGKLLEAAGNIKLSDEHPSEKLVSLLIPDLKETEAAELMQKYPKAQKVH